MSEPLLAAQRAPEAECPRCRRVSLLYATDHTDPESPLLCPACNREARRGWTYVQLCDNDPDHGPAWRNPYTRRDEYICGNCHAKSGDGVVLNKWAPRMSTPLGVHERARCEVAGGVVKPCKGEVKPRGPLAALLCNAHAGKTSAEEPYLDRM